jgi:hypothetical protein
MDKRNKIPCVVQLETTGAPQRNLVNISPINVISPICFHLYGVGNKNDEILLSKGAF